MGLIDSHGDLAEEPLNYSPPHFAEDFVNFTPATSTFRTASTSSLNVAH